MTCDDFRRHNSNGIGGILALTRAERSACARHWTECFECRDWTMDLQFKTSSAQSLEVERVKAADQQDAETYRPTAVEREKFTKQFDLDTRPANEPSESSKNE